MARISINTQQGPQEIPPSDKSVWICRCGLSKNQAFCDGSHHKTRDELAGKTYQYHPDGTRSEISP